MQSSRNPHYAWLLPLLAVLLITAALWLPFGLRRGAWLDSWYYWGVLEGGVLPIPSLDSRPLTPLMWQVALWFSSESWVGVNVLMIGFLMLRGLLAYQITRHMLPGHGALAFLVMLLVMIYPGESTLFNDNTINGQFGQVMYLLALLLLVRWVRLPRPVLLVGMTLAAFFAVFTYEAVLLLYTATPVLIVLWRGRFERRMLTPFALWVVPLVLFGLYLVSVYVRTDGFATRETSLLDSTGGLTDLASAAVSGVLFNLQRQFIESWRFALQVGPFGAESTLWSIALLTALAVGIIVYLYLRLPGALPRRPASAGLYTRVLALSFVGITLGYVVYAFTIARYDTYRVTYYSLLSIGLFVMLGAYLLLQMRAAFRWVLVGVCLLLAALNAAAAQPAAFTTAALVLAGIALLPTRLRLAAFAVGFTALSLTRTLDLQRWVTFSAQYVHEVMESMTEAAPALRDDTVLVMRVLPDDGFFIENLLYTFRGVVQTIYANHTINPLLCFPGDTSTSGEAACTVTPDGVRISDNMPVIPFESLVLMEYRPDVGVVLIDALPEAGGAYQPDAHIDHTAPPPSRIATMRDPRPLIAR